MTLSVTLDIFTLARVRSQPNIFAGFWALLLDPRLTVVAGFRVPMHIISPWTRGQKVFTEHADHASQILFVGTYHAAGHRAWISSLQIAEAWLKELGYGNIETKEMPPWRRAHMSNFLNAFDFDHVSPTIPDA